jgi:hypothetical protein
MFRDVIASYTQSSQRQPEQSKSNSAELPLALRPKIAAAVRERSGFYVERESAIAAARMGSSLLSFAIQIVHVDAILVTVRALGALPFDANIRSTVSRRS